MEELIICSPKGIPNKEKYLTEELEKVDNRRICSIKVMENGDIQILVEKDKKPHKYFAKALKKRESDYFDFINFLDRDERIIKFSRLVKPLEYDKFFVLLFEKIK